MVRRNRLCLMACLMMGGPGLAPAQEYAVDYQVIINASNSTRSLSRDQLKSIFLKKMTIR